MTMTMTSAEAPHSARFQPRPMPVSVQILSTLFYGVFAITAVAIAFAHFWPAGMVLAIILGWRGGFVPSSAPRLNPEELVEKVRALGPEAQQRTSGNASFDAYRSDMIERLEEEQHSFEAFLDRLRAAHDKTEFDKFMDDRAHVASEARASEKPADFA